MGIFSDLFDFEMHNLGGIFKKAKKNPERLFLGAMTPVGSKLWGTVLGKDYEPAVNLLGGPTDDTYASAQEEGINTGPASFLHKNVAEPIAGFFGMKGLGGFGGGDGLKLDGFGGDGLKGTQGFMPGEWDWQDVVRGGNSLGGLFGGGQQQQRERIPYWYQGKLYWI